MSTNRGPGINQLNIRSSLYCNAKQQSWCVAQKFDPMFRLVRLFIVEGAEPWGSGLDPLDPTQCTG
jgi:hypothetical protein